MYNFIGFVLDIKSKKNLIIAQKKLCTLSKILKKDDFLYVTGNDNVIDKKEFDAAILNYVYRDNLAEELDLLKPLTHSLYQFNMIYLIINDNQNYKNSIFNKINKIKKMADVIMISNVKIISDEDRLIESFESLDTIFKEIYGT